MYLYNSLRNLAITFGWLRREFTNWGNTIKGIYLIGQHLSFWIFSIADFFGDVERVAYDVADDWKSLYNWLIHNLGVSNIPSELLRYADDLISFIRDPFDWIADTIRDVYPALYKVAKDPVAWVLETIYRYTGLDIDFVDNPRRVIENIVDRLIGDFREIINDPYGWVVRQLDNIIPDFWRFIYDARGWVRDKIEDEFPFLFDFLRDPDGYINNKLENFIEGFVDKYKEKAIRVFEQILDTIF